jgi:AbrB family looped-hinge helix DNA binding protein
MPVAENAAPSGHTKLNENGRILIPASVRSKMGIKAGDSVVWTLEDGVLRVEAYRAVIRKVQDEMQKYKKPGVSMVDEFLSEKREEARREWEKDLG